MTRRALWLSLVLVCCVHALDPSLDISQYAHTAWRVRDGFARGFIYAVAQTPDGYLWVATEFGLLRFDGVRPLPWRPPAGQQLPGAVVQNLLVTRDGALWIGTLTGLARWKDGQITTFPELRNQRISGLLQDHAGTVWIGTSSSGGKLCTFQNQNIQCQGEDGRLASGAYPLYEDSKGNLWVGVTGGLWKWQPGRPEYIAIPDGLEGHPGIGEDSRFGLLIGTDRGMQGLVNGRVKGHPALGLSKIFRASRQPGGGAGNLRDRDGGLWIATRNRGLVHFHQGRTDTFSEADGLSGDTVMDLLDDREGNVWVVTTNGIDRFRGYAVPSIGTGQGLSNTNTLSVLATRDGSVWIGTYKGLNRWKDGDISVIGGKRGGALDGPTHSLFQDSGGRMWASTFREFGYLENDRFEAVLKPLGGWVYSVAEVPSGHLWVACETAGLVHLVNGRVVRTIPWATFGHKDHARVLLADRSQRGLWLGFAQGDVVYFSDGKVQKTYSDENGLGHGRVNGLRFGARGALWAATEGGLSRIRDGRVTTLNVKNGLPCDAAHWSMEDDDHSVWVYMECGLVRITRPELDAWVADPGISVKLTLFDNSDGVRSHSYPTEVHSISKASDGRIWFAAFDGVSILDPRRLRVNTVPPPVHIESVRADGKTYPLKSGTRLPPLVRDVLIDFTALSLTAPETIRFRYMLEGQDGNWKEVVNDRQAQYTNLPPGQYRFRVMACNNSGVWNETGDTLEFSIDPALYQTVSFSAACMAGFLVLLWGLHRLRLYQIRREFNAQLDGRVDERLRVARELHDTMLQSFQAALIQMQAARNIFARRPEKTEESLDKAINTAAGAIAEGRSAIQDLRLHPAGGGDLAQLLTTAGQELARSEEASGNPPAFGVTVEGARRALNPLLQDEVYRIARELLRNAFRHSQAGRIEVEIRYDSRQLRIHVRDDGKGIDPEVLKAGGRSGHYGLPGMRERANRFCGKLDFWSEAGAGTEAVLTVPAAAAYSAANGGRFSFLRRKKAGS